MSTSNKIKIYALFQFVTFVSYFILGITLILLAVNSDEWTKIIGSTNSQAAWLAKVIIYIFSFKIPGAYGISSSILFYTLIILIIISWIIGFQVVKTKNRNLLDSLFLLFAFVPLVSNILCLMAQVSSNTIAINYSINKEEEFKKQYSKAKVSKEEKLKDLKKQLYDLKQK